MRMYAGLAQKEQVCLVLISIRCRPVLPGIFAGRQPGNPLGRGTVSVSGVECCHVRDRANFAGSTRNKPTVKKKLVIFLLFSGEISVKI